ncbi:MAG: threonine/homoserine exporter RhtA [Neisseriaceae bacterium]|nr:threonine/homoserine exporter RhtA [Neisseriaceae bacterium]
MTATKQAIWFPIAILIAAMLSIQSGALLAKSLFPIIGAHGITALRLSIACVMLAVVFKPWRLKWHEVDKKSLLIYGLSLGGMNFLFYQSLNTVPLGIAVALEFTGPLAVAMFSARRPIDFVWVLLVMVGLYHLLPLGDAHNADLIGCLYALAAGVCWAVYIIYGQKAGRQHGSSAVAVGSLLAALLFFPIGLIGNGMALFDPAILPTAVAVAVMSTAVPYTLEMMALTRLPAKTFGTLMSLEPAVAAILGMTFLQEYLSLTQWLALLAVICASAGAALTIQPKPLHKKAKAP